MKFDANELLKPNRELFRLDYPLTEKERRIIDENYATCTRDLMRAYNRTNSLVDRIALIERAVLLVRQSHPLINTRLIEAFELLKQYDDIRKVNTVINLKVNTDSEVIKLGLSITKNSSLIIALKGLFLLHRLPEA